MSGNCTICGEGVAGSSHPCPRCETPHHEDCWEYNEGCGVYGCKAALVVAQGRVAEITRTSSLSTEPGSDWLEGIASLPTGSWQALGATLMLMGMCSALFFQEHLWIWLLPFGAGGFFIVAGLFLPELLATLASGKSQSLSVESPRKSLEARLGDDQENQNTLEMLAYLYYCEGRFEEALGLYNKALALPGDHSQLALRRALCLEKLGRTEAALEAFEALVTQDGHADVHRKAAWWVRTLRKRGASTELESFLGTVNGSGNAAP